MAAIAQDQISSYTQIEVYDFYKRESYDKSITLRLGTGSIPGYIRFSPQDKYLMISEIPVKGCNTLKLYEF